MWSVQEWVLLRTVESRLFSVVCGRKDVRKNSVENGVDGSLKEVQTRASGYYPFHFRRVRESTPKFKIVRPRTDTLTSSTSCRESGGRGSRDSSTPDLRSLLGHVSCLVVTQDEEGGVFRDPGLGEGRGGCGRPRSDRNVSELDVQMIRFPFHNGFTSVTLDLHDVPAQGTSK